MLRLGYLWRGLALAAVLVGFVAVRPAGVHAASLTVTDCTSDTNLRSAITQANNDNAGDTITFSCSGDIKLSSALHITGNMTVDGSGQTVTLDGQQQVQVFVVDNGVDPGPTVTLNHLAIANGSAPSMAGGGIYNNRGTLTVTNSTVSDNSAGFDGGGISSLGGSLSVTNSTFHDNSTTGGGGGIFIIGALTVTNSTFSGNTAGRVGGGISSEGGGGTEDVITYSTFSGNSGGGISIFRTSLSVSDSTFSGNSGGGIDNTDGSLHVANSTFSRNSTSGSGGGIVNNGPSAIDESAELFVSNSTFSDNSASGNGGGIINNSLLIVTNSTISGNSANAGGGIANSGYTELANTIVANSPSGGNCANSGGTLSDAGGNVDDGTTCIPTTSTTSRFNTDPQLKPLADNGGPTQTMALAPTSPAIGAGLAAKCLSTAPDSPVNNLDQRGHSRHADTRRKCDSGAYDTGGIVSDTTPPVLSLPGTITADATSPAGAVVTFTASATDPDNTPSQLTITCTPPSGSTFPIGTTTVTCTASDPAGNTSSGNFQVVVKGAVAQLTDLIGMVDSMGLPHGLQTSLEAKLRAALQAVNAGQSAAACGALGAFNNEVQAQTGKKLTEDQAHQLLAAAARIQVVLGC